MAEQQKKPVESATAGPGEQRSASRPRAAESGDPAVHKALADLQTARQNLAAVRASHDAEDPDAEQDEKDALKRLHDLGYGE